MNVREWGRERERKRSRERGKERGREGRGGIKGGGNQIEKCETLKGFIRPHLNFAYRLYVRCFWS